MLSFDVILDGRAELYPNTQEIIKKTILDGVSGEKFRRIIPDINFDITVKGKGRGIFNTGVFFVGRGYEGLWGVRTFFDNFFCGGKKNYEKFWGSTKCF